MKDADKWPVNSIGDAPSPWRPSIHMPRWASRLNLQVVNRWAERLQAITSGGALAEGIEPIDDTTTIVSEDHHERRLTVRLDDWIEVWDGINAKPKPRYERNIGGKRVITHYVSYPWKEGDHVCEYRGLPWYITGNPWLWVVEFERIDQ